jgi:hypothetical protein
MDETGAERKVAEQLLNEYGSVRKAADNYRANS